MVHSQVGVFNLSALLLYYCMPKKKKKKQMEKGKQRRQQLQKSIFDVLNVFSDIIHLRQMLEI